MDKRSDASGEISLECCNVPVSSTDNDRLKIRWIGQGGYLLKANTESICIDPYLSDCVERHEGLKRRVPIPFTPKDITSDIIIATHDHLDHLDEDTISQMDLGKHTFLGPHSCVKHFREIGIDDKNIMALNRDTSVVFGGFTIRGVHAEHTADSIGLVISYGGVTIYFTGDSLYSSKLLAVKKYHPDILVTCINGKLGNMTAKEAALLTEQLDVKTGIPAHYGMFAENTEDPVAYLDILRAGNRRGIELSFNKWYYTKDLFEK